MQAGSAIQCVGLNNSVLTFGKQVSQRIKPVTSGDISTTQPYLKSGAGYSGGTGGKILITLHDDAFGMPDSFIKAYSFYVPSNPVSPTYPLLTWIGNVSLIGGNIYHLVYQNIDPAPNTNYVSVNSLNNAGNAAQPFDSDCRLLRRTQPDAWSVQADMTPIVVIKYTNGLYEGQGYTDAHSSSGLVHTSLLNKVKAHFTYTGATFTPTKLYIFYNNIWNVISWTGGAITNGLTYDVVVPDGVDVFPVVKGPIPYTPNVFTDGYWMQSSDGGATWSSQTSADLMFRLE